MARISSILNHLSRSDVSELALATGRAAAAKISGVFMPLDLNVLSTENIVALIEELGTPSLQSVRDKPIRWVVDGGPVGRVAVTMARRGDTLQARFTRAQPNEPITPAEPPTAPAIPAAPTADLAVAAAATPALSLVPAAPMPPPLTSPTTPPPGVQAGRRFENLEQLLEAARACRASDLHIIAARSPLFRVAGDLWPGGELLEPERVERMIIPLIPQTGLPILAAHGSCDFALEHPTAGRFRVNVARQRTGLKACFRGIPREVPTLAALGLPEAITKALHHHQGLVVITGPSGQGKTTTLAALVGLINRETMHHVITVEDPVEFVHTPQRALISQREVGTHTASFQSALKASLREDPDVIVVGELRDLETVRMALAASETGHLLIATMNTPSAAKAIDRIIDVFPPAEQAQARMSLSVGLRLIVGQRLVPNKERNGLVSAVEVLPGSVALSNLIREEKTYQIPSLQQRGKGIGIIRMDESLAERVHQGKTTLEIAREFADSPEDLKLMLATMQKTAPQAPAPEAQAQESAPSPTPPMVAKGGA